MGVVSPQKLLQILRWGWPQTLTWQRNKQHLGLDWSNEQCAMNNGYRFRST